MLKGALGLSLIVCLTICSILAAEESPSFSYLTAQELKVIETSPETIVVQQGERGVQLADCEFLSFNDPTASDGKVVRFNTSKPQWNIQLRYQPGRLVPGCHYVIYIGLSFEKKGEAGDAIQYGIWDTAELKAVVDRVNIPLKMVEPNRWYYFRIGKFVAKSSVYAWAGVAQANLENLPYIRFDRFLIVPDPDYPEEKPVRDLMRNPGKRLVSLSNGRWSFVELDLSGAETLNFGWFARPSDAVAAVVIDYPGKRFICSDSPSEIVLPAVAKILTDRVSEVKYYQVSSNKTLVNGNINLKELIPDFQKKTVTVRWGLWGGGSENTALSFIEPTGDWEPLRLYYGWPESDEERLNFTSLLEPVAEQLNEQIEKANHKRLIAQYHRLPSKPAIGLAVAPAGEKYWKSDRPLDLYKPGVQSQISIFAARGEYENIQVLLANLTEQPIYNVAVLPSDLHNQEGKLFLGSNLTVHPAGFVKCNLPQGYPVHKTGWVPDPLIPPGSFSIQAGAQQPVWVTVHVPVDQPPGIYTGKLTVSIGNNEVDHIDLILRVFDFNLPDTPALKTCFYFDENFLTTYYGRVAEMTELKRFLRLLAEHRIAPLFFQSTSRPLIKVIEKDGKFMFTSPLADILSKFLLEECKVSAFGMNWWNTLPPKFALLKQDSGEIDWIGSRSNPGFFSEANSPKYKVILESYLKWYAQHLREKGWLDRAYSYVTDEPPERVFGELKNDLKMVKKVAPEIKTLVVGVWPPRFESNDLDIWCPLTRDFDPATSSRLQSEGKEVWWYVCNVPTLPYANFSAIEYPALDGRTLFWMTYKYGVSGFLFWATNRWESDFPLEKRWPVGSWKTDSGHPGANGDGYLMYPGPNFEPLSSIRLEMIRDGIEDYDYFTLLKQTLDRLKNLPDVQAQKLMNQYAPLLNIGPEIVKSLTEYTRDEQLLQKRRIDIAEAIENIRHYLKKDGR